MKKYKTCFIRETAFEDAEILFNDVRPDDLREITALTNQSPLMVLQASVKYSKDTGKCWTLLDNQNHICAIFGVGKTDKACVGVVWMMTSIHIKKIKRDLLKHSEEWINKMLGVFPVLYNVIDVRNTMGIKLLERMKFFFTATHLNLGNGETRFMEFAQQKEINLCALQ